MSATPTRIASTFLLGSCRRARLDSKCPSHVRGPKAINNFFFFFSFPVNAQCFQPESNRLERSRRQIFRTTHVIALDLILIAPSHVRVPKAVNTSFFG